MIYVYNGCKKATRLILKPSNLDLYNVADAAIISGNYTMADSLANVYIAKHPEQEYGYSLLARSAKSADVDSTQGTAFPALERYILLSKRYG